jgi:hypothetical protein
MPPIAAEKRRDDPSNGPASRPLQASIAEVQRPTERVGYNPWLGSKTSGIIELSMIVSTDHQTRWRQSMDVLAERLDRKLREWSPETAEQVRSQVLEIIELADQGLLDMVRSRQVEQEVLDLLDEPTPR